MYRIIDTIDYRPSWTFRYPDLQQKYGEGVRVILDPEQISNPPKITGQRVKLRLPNGTMSELEVAVVEANAGGVVSLFFRGVEQVQVPRGTLVSW